MPNRSPKTVLLIATLDTKSEEAAYVRDAIRGLGKQVLVLDASMRGSAQPRLADIDREMVAAAAGSSYERVLREPHHQAEEIMTAGTVNLVRQLYEQHRIDAVMGLGGFDGTLMATAAMRELPIGVPKLVVSAAACGHVRFGAYVGTKDILVLPSVTDILGINEILCKILDNAVGAVSGMLDAEVKPEITQRNLIAATVYGQTTPAGLNGKCLLEAAGFRMVAFHPNGVGGAAMEELIRQNVFAGVWDLTPQELSDQVVMNRPSGGEKRLEAAADLGIPQVVVPGCLDFVWDSPEVMRQRFGDRPTYLFNPFVLLVKLSLEEGRAVARLLAAKLNRCRGPVAVMLPLRGISMFDFPGGPFCQPGLNEALFEELKFHLDRSIPLYEIDAHINDPDFSSACAFRQLELLGSSARAQASGVQ